MAFVCDGVEVDFYFGGGGVGGDVDAFWSGSAICFPFEERVGDAEYDENVV
jgi:hypothetical protein